MLLLVAGLVVIVLVILVVVFLSVRSMRADEGNDHLSRPAGRDRAASGRDDLRRRGAGRQPARRRPAEDDWLADHEPDLAAPEHGSLPHPRSHQHDQDPGRPAGPGKRADTRRRQRQESGARQTGGSRDKSGADWSSDDWDGVSDEQYWAELSADKPLATTARSAQAGAGDARPDTAAWDREADADPVDTGGRRSRRDQAPARSQQEPAPTMAAAGASPAQFSLHPGSAGPDWPPSGPADPKGPQEPLAFGDQGTSAEPATSPGSWADPMSTGSVDTDPSIGMGGWQDAAADTAAWQTADRDAPPARDSRAWAEDPLTSPSFAEPSGYSADTRSYRGSHSRGRARPDDSGSGADGSSYGRGHDYQTVPAWDDSYGSHDDGWRDPGHEHPGGRLDPLPEPADRWYSAPASPGDTSSYRQPPRESWERGEADYEAGSRHDAYTVPGHPSWPDHHESDRYHPAAGYDADHGRGSASSGYDGYTGYDPAGYDPAGYGSAGYGSAGSGSGYGEAGYGTGQTGYESPGYGREYPQPDHGTPDSDYGLPAYGSGHGRYPGYDTGRR